VDGLKEEKTAGTATRTDVPAGAEGAGAGALSGTGTAAGAGAPAGREGDGADPEAGRIRLFGAAYRMLGSAREAEEIVREAFALVRPAAGAAGPGPAGPGPAGPGPAGTDGGPGGAGETYARLVREVFATVVRRAEAALRGRREGHSGTWLPEPVLTGGGVLGPLETAGARESVSMTRLVLLERLPPVERAAYVLPELFGYGPAEMAAVLGLPEARCESLLRRARQRVREGDGLARTEWSREQRHRLVDELLRALREGDGERAVLEELLADDVVAWSDGGWQPGTARRPVLGAVKAARFLAGLRARAPRDVLGTVAEVNGEAGVVAAAGKRVVGVLVPEFGERGLVGIRAVADPARLAFLNRQWAGRAAH
jgi:DNA-directed RNA polymerase specialized sigma24 family protein